MVGLLLLALAGCAGSGGGGSGDDTTSATGASISSGTLGGKAFTVVYGNVTQGTADGPISTDAEGALVAFNDAISTWGLSDNGLLRLQSVVTMNDGGSVTAMAYGASANAFTGGLVVDLSREDTVIETSLHFSVNDPEPSAYTVLPAVSDPAGALYFTTEFYNGAVPGYGGYNAGMAVYHPDTATPDICGDEEAFNRDSTFTPDGTHLGLLLVDITVSSFSATDTAGPCE